MSSTRRAFLSSFWGLSAVAALGREAGKTDSLPSWNEGKVKAAILDFVKQTTTKASLDFIVPGDRIAVFDNDGTLWPENPMPFEVVFSLDSAKAMMAKKPGLKDTPAYKALADGDLAALTDNHFHNLIRLVLDTHGGQTTDEFNKAVADWIAIAKHPRFKRLYSECTYQPMQELLTLLRANGYRTYIVSGGSQDFMRVWAQKVYGVPPEQVIGTVFKTKYELKDDMPTLTILPEIALNDDKAGKPVAIHHIIGKRPVLCCGNSDGDREMLQYTTIGHTPSFGLIVHHTDREREYAYDANPKSTGKLVEGLAEAPKRGWVIADMKSDWKKVFRFDM